SHARYFDPVPPLDAPTLSDAAGAVSYLEEISPQMRGCAILAESGDVLAASGEPERWGEAGRDLLAAADEAGGEPVAHAHVATGGAGTSASRSPGPTTGAGEVSPSQLTRSRARLCFWPLRV